MANKKKILPEATLYDYLDWRGDLSFAAVPLTEVDNLIFSLIAYIDFSEVVSEERKKDQKPDVLLEVTKGYLKKHPGIYKSPGVMIPKDIITLLARASKTQRFGAVRPFCYIQKTSDKEQLQFSAISFLLPGGDVFVAFRGTDDSLVGWKENFNMSFMHPVPAQREALAYLEMVAALTKGKIFVGGHSKGGNLAVYSAAKSSEAVKSRIADIYNNDGPGFDKAFITGKDYISVRERIHTLVPQSSVVGMLLEHEEQFTVVKSVKEGLLQHNGFTWALMGSSFIHLDDVDTKSRRIDAKLKDWLSRLSIGQREKFIDAIYQALSATSAKTLSELNADKLKLVKAWNAMDEETRIQLKRCLILIIGRKDVKELKATEN